MLDVQTLPISVITTTQPSMSGNSKHTANDAPNEQTPVIKGDVKLRYVPYGAEKESTYLPAIRRLISQDLSEPYSIYVYRYFLYEWGELCFMVGLLDVILGSKHLMT